MSEQPTPFSPFSELEIGRRQEQLRSKYQQFLAERGVVFNNSPDSDIENQQRPEVLTNLLYMNYLAVMRGLAEITGRQTSLAEGLAETRLSVAQTLWENLRWTEPWISLVNQEFPGPGPTELDLERWIVQGRKRRQSYGQLLAELDSVLLEAGLATTFKDRTVLSSITLSVLTFRRLQLASTADVSQLISRHLAARESIAGASHPADPAWKVLLDRYFPVPDELSNPPA